MNNKVSSLSLSLSLSLSYQHRKEERTGVSRSSCLILSKGGQRWSDGGDPRG